MTSLNGITFFVDTIGCRNFILTHKKVMHKLYFPKTRQFIHIFKNMLV